MKAKQVNVSLGIRNSLQISYTPIKMYLRRRTSFQLLSINKFWIDFEKSNHTKCWLNWAQFTVFYASGSASHMMLYGSTKCLTFKLLFVHGGLAGNPGCPVRKTYICIITILLQISDLVYQVQIWLLDRERERVRQILVQLEESERRYIHVCMYT